MYVVRGSIHLIYAVICDSFAGNVSFKDNVTQFGYISAPHVLQVTSRETMF